MWGTAPSPLGEGGGGEVKLNKEQNAQECDATEAK